MNKKLTKSQIKLIAEARSFGIKIQTTIDLDIGERVWRARLFDNLVIFFMFTPLLITSKTGRKVVIKEIMEQAIDGYYKREKFDYEISMEDLL